eukprot:gene3512-biopygen3523
MCRLGLYPSPATANPGIHVTLVCTDAIGDVLIWFSGRCAHHVGPVAAPRAGLSPTRASAGVPTASRSHRPAAGLTPRLVAGAVPPCLRRLHACIAACWPQLTDCPLPCHGWMGPQALQYAPKFLSLAPWAKLLAPV